MVDIFNLDKNVDFNKVISIIDDDDDDDDNMFKDYLSTLEIMLKNGYNYNH